MSLNTPNAIIPPIIAVTICGQASMVAAAFKAILWFDIKPTTIVEVKYKKAYLNNVAPATPPQ